jgi:hypothetical protein
MWWIFFSKNKTNTFLKLDNFFRKNQNISTGYLFAEPTVWIWWFQSFFPSKSGDFGASFSQNSFVSVALDYFFGHQWQNFTPKKNNSSAIY